MSAFGRLKRVQLSRNHTEFTFTTTGGTENLSTLVSGIATVTNRANQIKEGGVLRKMSCMIYATDATPVNGKHQCMMFFRPGGSALPTPIAAWFDQTDPLTEDAIDIRRDTMSRRGPHTRVIISGQSGPLVMHCFWKGRRILRDGDDVILSNLDANATSYTVVQDYVWEEA